MAYSDELMGVSRVFCHNKGAMPSRGTLWTSNRLPAIIERLRAWSRLKLNSVRTK
jgi:hypothetical protein